MHLRALRHVGALGNGQARTAEERVVVEGIAAPPRRRPVMYNDLIPACTTLWGRCAARAPFVSQDNHSRHPRH